MRKLAFIAGFSFLYISCGQEDEAIRENQSGIKNRPAHQEYLDKYIENSGITSRSTTYSLNDAMSILNDGMNFLYCRPDEYYYETVISVDTFTLSISSGQVDEADLLDLMEDIAEFAGDFYHRDTRTDKQPLIFDINQLASTSTIVNIQAIFHYTVDLPPSPGDSYPYEESWYYGYDGSSSCSGGEGFDAADLYRIDLRNDIVYRSKVTKYYFKNPYYVCFSTAPGCNIPEVPHYGIDEYDEQYGLFDLINPGDVTIEDNLFDYLLYSEYSGWPNFSGCLSIEEMDFHFEQMKDLALDVLPSPPGNNVIANVEVGYLWFLDELESVYDHGMLVIRATKVPITEQEHEEAMELP